MNLIGALLLGAVVVSTPSQAQPRLAATKRATPNPAKTPGGYRVQGTLQNAPVGTKVYLADSPNGQLLRFDSATVRRGGAFSLSGQVPEPAVYFFTVAGHSEALPLPLTNGARLHLTGDATHLLDHSKVAGTAEADILQQFTAAQARRQAVTNALIQKQDWTPVLWEEAGAALAVATKLLVRQHPASLASAYAVLSLVGSPAHDVFVDSMTNVLAGALPDSRYVRELLARRRALAATTIGQLAPELSLPTLTGTLVSLASLRGKYVLIDFWASWCKPCRAESPNLVRLYSQYHAAGLELLGVSFDETRKMWERAVAVDKLPGVQVIDLAGMQGAVAKTYAAQAIPLTLLLDPEGRIIAKNLRGEELATTLANLFPTIR